MKQYSWMMTDRQLCDIEMILDGSFNPLNHFMNEDDYKRVLNDMRLANGKLFPLPITLDVDKEFSKKVSVGEKIILREKEGFKVASMIITSIWEPNFNLEASRLKFCLLYTSPSPRDATLSRMPSSA